MNFYSSLTMEERIKSHNDFLDISKDLQDIESKFNENDYKKCNKELAKYLDNLVNQGIIKSYNINISSIGIDFPNGYQCVYLMRCEELLDNDTDILNTHNAVQLNSLLSSSASSQTTRKVITLSPMPDLKSPQYDNSAREIVSKVNNYQFSANANLDNETVTIDVLKNLQDYSVIIIETHGDYDIEKGDGHPCFILLKL